MKKNKKKNVSNELTKKLKWEAKIADIKELVKDLGNLKMEKIGPLYDEATESLLSGPAELVSTLYRNSLKARFGDALDISEKNVICSDLDRLTLVEGTKLELDEFGQMWDLAENWLKWYVKLS